jgi:hypothetical protein
VHVARADVAHQRRHRRQALADEHQPGGIAVEPVHDAGPRQAGRGRVVGQQAVEQGARPVARRRVHDQPGRLVDDQQVRIFEHDRERHRFGLEGAAFVGRHEFDRQPLPGPHPARGGALDRPVQARVAQFEQALQVVARKLRRQHDQCLVKAAAVLRGVERLFAQLEGLAAVGIGIAFSLVAAVGYSAVSIIWVFSFHRRTCGPFSR